MLEFDDEIKEAKLKQEIALYQTDYGSVLVLGVSKWTEKDTEMVRVSKPVSVQFTPLTPEEIVPAQIAVLEEKAKKIRAASEMELTDIQRRINELLALPAPSE